MSTTIIMAHPWHGSLNKAILDKVTTNLDSKGISYNLIDLNKEEFNPVLNEEDLKLFAKGDYQDEKVGNYQKVITNTKEIIFIFPIWWYGIPAILKGFMEKVMLKGFAYDTSPIGALIGKLTHIKRSTVITTSGSPTWMLKLFFGNPLKKSFLNGTLKTVGIKNSQWINFPIVANDINKMTKKISILDRRFK